MTPIIHCLSVRSRARLWLVRTDGQPDQAYTSQTAALAGAREHAASLANRMGAPVTVRVWSREGLPTDETIHPPRNRD